MNTQIFDLIVIGGGAAGIMAAISFKREFPGKSVVILDRSFELGRKILVCGAGRCNLTNVNLNNLDLDNIVSHYYSSSKNYNLIKAIFNDYSYRDIIRFFDELGVEVYTERKTNIGKVFPITDSAKTITEVLFQELNRLDVKVKTLCEVNKVVSINGNFSVYTSKAEITQRKMDELGINASDNRDEEVEFNSRYLIISTGGKTYPALGSNGSAYPLLQNLGHTIVLPVPSALPLISSEPICKLLSGQKIELLATSYIDGKTVKTTFDDVMFTDYGLSGPAILNLSREISININRNENRNCQVKINFLTNQDGSPRSLDWFELRIQSTKSLYYALIGVLPNKIAKVLDDKFGDKLEVNSEKSIQNIFNELTNYYFKISDTKSWNEAEFTSGGVDLVEVKNTLESKLVENLFFAGEVLDVDGDVGGYNLSWAWASGWLAGKLKL